MSVEVDQATVRHTASHDQQALLIGRRYERAKRQGARKDLTSGQNDHKPTSATIAADHGVSEVTVRRNARFAAGVSHDTIHKVEAVAPEIETKVILGKGPTRKQAAVDDSGPWWPARAFSRLGIGNDSLRQALHHGQIRALRPGQPGNLTKQNCYHVGDVRRRWPHRWPTFGGECVKKRESGSDPVAS